MLRRRRTFAGPSRARAGAATVVQGKGRGVVSANSVGYERGIIAAALSPIRGRERISRIQSRQDSMTDHSNDETRLQATETQMRRALGLQSTAAPPLGDIAPAPTSAGPRRPQRRFVRDGEVTVSLVHHEAAAGTNRL